MKVWLDGALLPEEEARISPFDHGLMVGDGVFETLRVYGGVPFAWSRHLHRLASSAEALSLALPQSETLRLAVDTVLGANDLTEARVRITVTGGPSPLGSARGGSRRTVLVAASPLDPLEPAVDVVVAPWPRNQFGALAGVKSISYAENVRALAWAGDRGATEAVFADLSGNLCEGTGTNLFMVESGELITPPLSTGCLAGVTRDLVLEACRAEGLPVREEDRAVFALSGAEEAFLTSTTREVQPIRMVHGKPLPAAPGPITEKVAQLFRDVVAGDPDP